MNFQKRYQHRPYYPILPLINYLFLLLIIMIVLFYVIKPNNFFYSPVDTVPQFLKKLTPSPIFFQIEIKLVCHLTTRQRRLYQAVKNKISIDDLVYTSTSSSSTNATTSSLMNLVMQFRKVTSGYS